MGFTWVNDISTDLVDNTISATGGTITYYGLYTVHTFTSSGTFTVTGSGHVEYLIGGGGGTGGSAIIEGGGGGGAGDVKVGSNMLLNAGDYPVVVGAVGNPGGNSSFNSITATGGNRGNDSYESEGSYYGGTGGGSGSGYTGGSFKPGYIGWGGAGAGATGNGNQMVPPNNEAKGGSGLTSSITGTTTEYGVGGDGGNANEGGGYQTDGKAAPAGVVIIRYPNKISKKVMTAAALNEFRTNLDWLDDNWKLHCGTHYTTNNASNYGTNQECVFNLI